ncbi:M23 family metallopeptidase [Arthrobacter luteolus]|uniref:M23 family metallopeptidase n=1 Tax=Arthrobacter luteolus TaxID=98672 RepID=UPI00082D41DA|nr:M23 family metallopeptidase [Arthrobacter luteolus]
MTIFDRWPVALADGAYISQDFGVENTWESPPWHKGIDIAAPAGTPIVAPCDGFVVWASFGTFPPGNTWEMIPFNGGSGGCTILQPSAPGASAIQTSFSHQSRIDVKPGDFVRAGQIIGAVGSTGNSSGPHTHWEAFIDYAEGIYPAGTFYGRVNPRDYFTTSTVIALGTGGKGTVPAGAITPEEGNMAVQIEAQQAEDIAKRAAALVVEQLNNRLLINPVQAESIVAATTARTIEGVKAQADGKTINRQQADDIAQAAARYSKEK